MPTFSYSAQDANGNPVTGSIEAEGLSAARAALYEQNMKPTEVYQATKHVPPAGQPPQESSPIFAPPAAEIGIWKTTEEDARQMPVSSSKVDSEAEPRLYHPIVETVRLYAGWLLAFYVLAFSVGFYQTTRPLPFVIPFVDELLVSPLLLFLTFGLFLFLLLHTVHRALGSRAWSGVLAVLAWVGGFLLFYWNVL